MVRTVVTEATQDCESPYACSGNLGIESSQNRKLIGNEGSLSETIGKKMSEPSTLPSGT